MSDTQTTSPAATLPWWLVLGIMLGGSALAYPIAKPMWDEMVAEQDACATPAERRTAAQARLCESARSRPTRVTLIIPGIM